MSGPGLLGSGFSRAKRRIYKTFSGRCFFHLIYFASKSRLKEKEGICSVLNISSLFDLATDSLPVHGNIIWLGNGLRHLFFRFCEATAGK